MEHLVDDLMAIVNDLKGKNVILNNLGMFDVRALKAHNKESAPQRSNSPIVPFTREEVAAADCIVKAIKILPLLLRKTTRKAMTGSYGLKHYVERLITSANWGSYMGNGHLILAMLYLKYDYKPDPKGSLNCFFLADYADNDFRSARADTVAEHLKI